MAITFKDATSQNTVFGGLFSDSETTATWYQLWTGNAAGDAGSFVDTSAFNTFGNGWIEVGDINRLDIDFAQADDSELWVRTWNADDGNGAWEHGAVDYSAATNGDITTEITANTAMDDMFVDQDTGAANGNDVWYQLWVGNAEGTSGDFLSTDFGNGWVEDENLGNYNFLLEDAGKDLWVRVWNDGQYYEWEHWTVTAPAGTGQTFTLTTGADAPIGGGSDDTFVASEATLSSADVLDGGDGSDTLRYASSGNAPVNEAGFEAKNIEIVQVTSDATGGTTFDVTGVTEVTTLRNYNSSEDLTLTGMDSLVDVELQSVGSAGAGANDPTPDTALVFNAAVVAGTDDALNVSLNGNQNVDGTAIGDLTANGVETFNVSTTGAPTMMTDVVSNTLETINVTGDQNLSIAAQLNGATTVNAAVTDNVFSGDLSVVLDSNGVAQDVVVTGGSGDDMADFSAGFEDGDSFDGGDGVDTIGVNNALATGNPQGALADVEQLLVTDGGNGTVDMADFPGIERVIFDAGLAGNVLVDNAVSGITVEVDVANSGNDLEVDLATDGTADEVSLVFDELGGIENLGTVTVDDAETLNIEADDDSADGTGEIQIANLEANDLNGATLNLTGDALIDINGLDVNDSLSAIDAGTQTGGVELAGYDVDDFADGGATIVLGSGDDRLENGTGNGADTVTLGAGEDTVSYTNTNQSDDDRDTITDFVSGTDQLDFSALDGNTLINFVGNRDSFGQAQGALPGTSTPGAGLSAVFQSDDSILWIDSDDNGTLDNNDFRVLLQGVDGIVAADVGLAGGNTINLTAPNAVVNGTTMTNATNMSTVQNDTFVTTVANLNGSNLAGLQGTDVLTLSDATGAGLLTLGDGGTGGTIATIESLTLANGTNNVAFQAGSTITNVTGGTQGDTVAIDNLAAGGNVSTGDGTDAVTSITDLAGTTVALGDGDDSFTSAIAGAITTTLNGGDGANDLLSLANTNDISGATVSNFEDLTIAAGGAVTMTVAQNNAFTGTVTATGGETVTLTNAGTITGLANVETYVLANGTNDLTVHSGVAAPVVTGGTGADTVSVTSVQANNAAAIALAVGNDTLEITGGITGAHALTNDTGIETVEISGASTANILTVANANGTTAIDASGVTGGGVSLDISGLDTTNGNTTVTLTDGNDTLATSISGAGNSNLVINFGQGSDTVTDIAVVGTGTITMNFGISAAGNVDANTIAATTADLATGDVISFDGINVGALADSLANSQLGGATNTVVVANDATDTTITLDQDANGVIDAGADVQIQIMGQALTPADFNLVGGDLVFA